TLNYELLNVKTELLNTVNNLKYASLMLRDLSIYNGSPVVSYVKDSLNNFKVLKFKDFKDKDTIKVIVDEAVENRKLV
ncbi:6604_t:CDS:2, partial [Cetraspora pellucida]